MVSTTYIIRKKLGYVESKSTVDRGRIRAMFKLVALLTLITAVSFYFVFDQVVESAKPDVPKEKFDAEVLAGLFILILVVSLYLSAPLLIVVIIAHGYGYGWRDLRCDPEARRKMSYVYILYLLLLFLSVMCWALVKSVGEYITNIIEDKILLIIAGELLLALLFVAILVVILRLHGYEWGDVKRIRRIFDSLASIDKPRWMLSKDSEELKGVNLMQSIVLIVLAYLILAFMLAEYALIGKANEKLVLFVLMGVVFLLVWNAVEFWGRRGKRK